MESTEIAAKLATKINYVSLNEKQQEAYNFQKFAAVLADYGFNCIKLADDWNGADFIALHIDSTTLRVQLKGRLTIDKKYCGKDLWMAFRVEDRWYLVPHDELARDQDLPENSPVGWCMARWTSPCASIAPAAPDRTRSGIGRQ